MKRTINFFASVFSFALLFLPASSARAQIDVGDFTISGGAEVGGLPGNVQGNRGRYEEYRDLPESVIVPQLQLMIGGKKEDFYLNFDASKVGRDDQNYRLRVGRYGLLDMEFEWDQIPHIFSDDIARSPYRGVGGGNLTLASKPTATVTSNTASLGNPALPATFPNGTQAFATCAENPFCTWLNANANPLDLQLLNRIARFKLRYTPSPGWTFTANYSSQETNGTRAFGSYVGGSPGSYNITELPEPLQYQTHNVELGGEYAGKGWSLALKYNVSLFHNSVSSLVWDNPINLSGVGTACKDKSAYSMSSTTGAITASGPCRSRTDLYPSNLAHTITLMGTADLPLKTRFLGTVSYGWRLQDDHFVPFTINSCYGSGAVPSTCADAALTAMPTISKNSLNGDVRPLMVNATLVNNSLINGLNIKAYYRLFDLSNRSNKITFNNGLILNDRGTAAEVGAESRSGMEYSKNTVGLDAGYDITRWLTAKLGYSFDKMHRVDRQVRNTDEHTFGPTVDIKPSSWLLLRASYKHSWRTSPHYEFEDDVANIGRMFDQANRDRDKASLFAQISPWDRLTFDAGFEVTGERYDAVLGTQNDYNYSPSIGFSYVPLDWLSFFGNYNWERFDWLLQSMQRSSTTQDPRVLCASAVAADQNACKRLWTSHGRDSIHNFSLGSDASLIPNLLRFRIQYGFSFGESLVHSKGATCLNGAGLPFPAGTSGGVSACTPATDYPSLTNIWHELLARLEYQVHRNVALTFGYYFNHANEKDPQVDIMQPWMGANDQWSITGNANLGRSMFLGDHIKGPYTAHVGFVSLKFKF